MIVGILALQGAFRLHQEMLNKLGVETRLVKKETDLDGLDAIVIPGGESTVLNKHLERSGLGEILFKRINEGLFAFGTCAGLILLAQHKILDCEVQRNAYGTQKDSFMATINLTPTSETIKVAFIRAPRISEVSENVKIISTHEDEIVGVMSDKAIGVTFHSEVTGDDTLHRFFVEHLRTRLI